MRITAILLLFTLGTFSEAKTWPSVKNYSFSSHSMCYQVQDEYQCRGVYPQEVYSLSTSFQIVDYSFYTCAYNETELKCWFDSQGIMPQPLKVPNLNKIRKVVVTGAAACALADGEVTCWGDDPAVVEHVPQTKAEPTDIAGGVGFACIIDEGRPKCWGGWPSSVVEYQAKMTDAVKIVAFDEHVCALGEDSVECWGTDYLGETQLSNVIAPTDVAVGILFTCVLDANGAKCYGLVDEPRLPLSNPTRIFGAPLSWGACARTDEGVECWGWDPTVKWGTQTVGYDINELSAGFRNICAKSKGAWSCWGGQSITKMVQDVPADSLVMGQSFACGLDRSKNKITCYGQVPFKDKDLSFEKPIKDIYATSMNLCVHFTDELLCVGEDKDINYVPPLDWTQTNRVFAGYFDMCVEFRNILYCWGSSSTAIKTSVQNLQKFSRGYSTSCRLDNHKVECWGSAQFGEDRVPVNLGPVSDLFQMAFTVCAKTIQSEIRCWGKFQSQYEAFYKKHAQLEKIITTHSGACGFDNKKLRCLGYIDEGEMSPPQFKHRPSQPSF